MLKRVLVLYVPVLHQGYISFFEKWRFDVDEIYIFGKDITEELSYLEPEIRAMDPCLVDQLIHALGFFRRVVVLSKPKLWELRDRVIITADEGISRRLVQVYLQANKIQYENVFLRWDERHVAIKKPPESFAVSLDSFDMEMMELAREEGLKSSDWWRQVGSILVKNGQKVLHAHNTHMPTELSPYVVGDIRDFIKAGEHSDISSALHSEKAIVSLAAKKGVALEGADLYVSTFPCSDCAAVVAFSGIKRCFFGGGHASFNGENILKLFKVEMIYVE